MAVVVIFIWTKETQSRHLKAINKFIIQQKHRLLKGEGECAVIKDRGIVRRKFLECIIK